MKILPFLVFFLLSSCSQETGVLGSESRPVNRFCLKSYSSERMAELYIQLLESLPTILLNFENNSVWPLFRKRVAFAGPKLEQRISAEAWFQLEADINGINNKLLRIGSNLRPNKNVENIDFRVLVTSEEDKSLLVKEKSYITGTPFHQAHVSQFIESGSLCNYWQRAWETGSSGIVQQINVYISLPNNFRSTKQERITVSECVLSAMIGNKISNSQMQNFSEMVLEVSDAGPIVVSDFFVWVYWLNFEKKFQSLTKDGATRKNLINYFETECM